MEFSYAGWRVAATDDQILLIKEILHHLGCTKPCTSWDNLPIKWCSMSYINSTTLERLANFHLHFLISIYLVFLWLRPSNLESGNTSSNKSCWLPKGAVVFPKDFCADPEQDCNFTNRRYTPPKTEHKPLKNNGWKTILSLFEMVTFQGTFVHFRGCTFWKEGRINNRSDSIPIFLRMKNPGLSYGTHWYSIKHTLLRTNISHLWKRNNKFPRYL